MTVWDGEIVQHIYYTETATGIYRDGYKTSYYSSGIELTPIAISQRVSAIPTTPLLASNYVAPNNAAIALLLAANWTWTKSGNIITYVSPDGLTHISYTPNASGGVDAAIV